MYILYAFKSDSIDCVFFFFSCTRPDVFTSEGPRYSILVDNDSFAGVYDKNEPDWQWPYLDWVECFTKMWSCSNGRADFSMRLLFFITTTCSPFCSFYSIFVHTSCCTQIIVENISQRWIAKDMFGVFFSFESFSKNLNVKTESRETRFAFFKKKKDISLTNIVMF